ncbi:putative pentatricopeptide repeat-containing protein [Stylosanthes scabra]|uniref:Pentatricopeptide repeat-containing protein n=1 Tax=Stylosanthes scabra TaxID=79078 RepID=A0ABU6XYH8_9FABA|nr:putative pentatricopeptide repeat-containing protein [Stylosanthes scabra]
MVFCGMARRDIISWSTIITVYSQAGYAKEAFDYLSWMRREGPKPNEFAFASLLSVSGSMALLEPGKQVHAHVLCIGLDHEVMVHSALISMYSKCGSLKEASKVFDETKTNDIISWTAMINGYAEHGCSQEAIRLFEKIPSIGLKPDYVTFIGVLTACSHAGLVDQGFRYFKLMIDEYRISPSKEHYGCMIDLLCRAGRLSEAVLLIQSMPFHSDDVVWSTLLRAYQSHPQSEQVITVLKLLGSRRGDAWHAVSLGLTDSCSISLPDGSSFHPSLTIGHPGVFSLARWSMLIHTCPMLLGSERKLVMLSATALSPSRVLHSTASPSSTTLV